MIAAEFAPWFALAVLVAMLALFVWERWPPEVVAIGAVGLLLATQTLTSGEALAALSNPAPVTIACMLMLSGALIRVGALDAASALISKHAKQHPARVILAMGVFVMTASAFMNNTPLVVMMMPLTIALAQATQVSPSKLLIPLSYAAMLGGTCTLIGTSTNLLVDGVARDAGMAPFSLFEIAPVGLAVSVVGMIYLVIAAPRLLPDHRPTVDMGDGRRAMKFLSEVALAEGSPLIGRRVLAVEAFQRDGLSVADVLRGEESLRRDLPDVTLEAGDRIVLRSGVHALLNLRQSRNLGLIDRLSERSTIIVEALISPGCALIGRSLGKLRLRRRYGVYPLAVHRRDQPMGSKLDDIVIRVGDTLLLDGAPDDLQRLADDVDLVQLQAPTFRPYRRTHAPIVLAVLAAVVGLSAFDVLPIATLTLIGVAVVLLTGCIDADEAFDSIDGRLLALIVAMLAVGTALEKTGAVTLVVDAVQPTLALASPAVVLYLLIVFTCILTEALSNNAVAVLMTPVAISLAQSIGVDPRPFVVGVMIAASASFATPVGYQTNMLVYAPGGYRFMDFVRIGAPLNIIVGIVAALVIPMVWSF